MNRYPSIRFMRPSLVASVVENQLPDVGALPALVELEASVTKRLVDSELQRHRSFRLVAKRVLGAVLHPIERVELVDHIDARLVDPDTDVVAGLVGHTRAHTAPPLQTTDTEGCLA
jgi:hypothetical protein